MDEPLEGTETPTDQALTKTTKKGRRYKRRSVVDQQIRAVSSLSPDKLVEYARIRQKDNPHFLSEEAIVYFIQQFHQKGSDSVRDQLIAELIGRCSKIIYSHVRGLSISLEDAANEVIEELFRRIVAPNKDLAAYLQVNFWDALKKIAIDVRRKYPVKFVSVSGEALQLPKRNSLEVTGKTDLPAEIDADIEIEEVEDGQLPVKQLVEEITTVQGALQTIPEPARTAFILYYYYEWPIQSIKPDMQTISSYFNVDEKTVRNWLKQAKNYLKKWYEEQKEL